jgi:DNA topoisomerase-1
VVKEGRFGPYVTDGVTNASLHKGDSIEDLTTQRAAELMAARRERDALAPPKAKRASRTTRSTTPRRAAGKR